MFHNLIKIISQVIIGKSIFADEFRKNDYEMQNTKCNFIRCKPIKMQPLHLGFYTNLSVSNYQIWLLISSPIYAQQV